MSAAARPTRFRRSALALMLGICATLVGACAGTGGGKVSGTVYVGAGYYDPWYWGPGYIPPPGAIGPPPRPVRPPPRPTHPIARPPSRPPAMRR